MAIVIRTFAGNFIALTQNEELLGGHSHYRLACPIDVGPRRVVGVEYPAP